MKFFRITLFSFSVLMLPIVSLGQNTSEVKISLHLQHATLKELIRLIEERTSFRFMAKAEDVEAVTDINIDAENQPLNRVLDKAFAGTGLQYKQTEKNLIIQKLPVGKSLLQPASNVKNQTYVLHGTIKAERTGEALIGATVSILGLVRATATNEYGFYSLSLPTGNHTVLVTAIGMQTKEVNVSVAKDVKLDVTLIEEATSLQEVTVVATPSGRSLKNPQMSVERINVQELRNVPVLFGERDILKTIQLLPGVKSAGEGNSGFYVRGGGADQNLILLDEAPVYNAAHLLGFFSTFNSDAIKNVTLYKGAMPAQYGGRLSSVVDVKMNDGNNQDLSVSGGIGLIASRLNVEGPIQKDKSSFLLSGRRTYADVFLKLMGDSTLKRTKLYFYDLNAKMNFTLSDRDKLFVSGYFGRDVLSQDKLAGIDWGNTTGTIRWNHVFNKRLFLNTSLIYSNYDYKIKLNSESTDYGILSRIRDWNVKQDFEWYLNTKNTMRFGGNFIYHTIKPGEISVISNGEELSEGLPDRYSSENAIYITNNWRASNRWSFDYGTRLSIFSILGKGDYYNIDNDGGVLDTLRYKRGEVVKTYINPEPRVAASYQLNTSSSLKFSYTRNTQNLHLISNSTSSSPTDKWVSSTNIIKPEIADQLAVGYYKNLIGAKYELNIEAYYKNMQRQIDYRDGAQVFTNSAIETQLLFGKGRAYGIEWLMRKNAGRFKGWISYTLSKTERKINGINNNQWYNARQDRTHDIAIVGLYQLNNKWSLSANWVFYTGDAVTYPSGKYKIDGEVYFYYSERNGYRMPNYHRLDLGATKQLKKGKRFSSELAFSIYNAYGRANAYQINFQESEDNPDKTEAIKTSLFTFVPSISYNFKF